ncbi:MAG: hypothetical protein JHC81_04980 [Brevundimonas sp.]|uniref:hypothetical protein n=1 Tax=Brevundimonas sp. TaxID=1871086 RepID=UPI001A180D35|nr:hypothetical protein [Brevundimonas sp.]MBJ7446869.1 hypothetical protein [Brevundimonas sp.]
MQHSKVTVIIRIAKGLGKALRRPWRVWLWTLALGVLLLLTRKLAPDGKSLEYIGAALQIVGLGMVLRQLFQTAAEFSVKPFKGVLDWFDEIYRLFRPRSHSIVAEAGAFIVSGGDVLAGTASSYDPKDVNSRLDHIERVIEAHKAEETARRAEIWKGIEGLQAEMKALIAEQQAKAEAIAHTVRTQSVGSLDTSIIGVFLTIVGTALSSI